MTRTRLSLLSVCCLLSLAVSSASQTNKRIPVLVELFTSEGCSTCPPADALLSRLKFSQPFATVQIIPIALHVDYWNHQGWTDKFSSPQYTERQADYVNRLKDQSPYTPQMVVDGLRSFNGSNSSLALSAIERAAALPKPVTIQPTLKGNRLSVMLESDAEIRADVFLAIVEDDLETKVLRGENGGRVLRHNSVVRALKKIGTVKKQAWSQELELPKGKGWKQADLQVVVFVQQHSTGQILGVVSIPIS